MRKKLRRAAESLQVGRDILQEMLADLGHSIWGAASGGMLLVLIATWLILPFLLLFLDSPLVRVILGLAIVRLAHLERVRWIESQAKKERDQVLTDLERAIRYLKDFPQGSPKPGALEALHNLRLALLSEATKLAGQNSHSSHEYDFGDQMLVLRMHSGAGEAVHAKLYGLQQLIA